MFFLFWSDSLSTIFQPCSRTRPTPINPPPPNGHDRCLVLRFTRKAVRAKTQGRAVQRPQASGRQRRCEALLPHQALHEAARALHSGHGVGARDTRSEEVQPSLGGLSFSRVWDGMGWDGMREPLLSKYCIIWSLWLPGSVIQKYQRLRCLLAALTNEPTEVHSFAITSSTTSTTRIWKSLQQSFEAPHLFAH